MTAPSTHHPHDDLAVYALDGLDGDGRFEVERHLEACAQCRRELADHRETVARLAVPGAPPPRLWERIAAGIEPVSEPAVSRPARGRTRWDRVAVGAAAAAALVMVTFGVGRNLGSSGSSSVATLARGALADDDSVVSALSSPAGDRFARVVIGDEGTFVVLDDLPPLDEDHVYQLWHLDGATPVSLGVIDDREGVSATTLPSGVRHLAITVEPAGGAPAPSGSIVARGTLISE